MEPPETILPQDIPPQAILPQTSPTQTTPHIIPPQIAQEVPSSQEIEDLHLTETKSLASSTPQQPELQETSYQEAAAPTQPQTDPVLVQQELLPPNQQKHAQQDTIPDPHQVSQSQAPTTLSHAQQAPILDKQSELAHPIQAPTLSNPVHQSQAPILSDPTQQVPPDQAHQEQIHQEQTQQAAMKAALDKQSEFHGDYNTIVLSKPSPRGIIIKVVAHLGLPGGAMMHLQKCMALCTECTTTLEKCDLVKSKSKLTIHMADMFRKLGLLRNLLTQFEGVLTVPDGALSPSLRSVFIIVEKFLITLRSHLATINRVTYHPNIGLGMRPGQRSKVHIDLMKLDGILTLVRYSFDIHCQVSKDGRICPFLLGQEQSSFNIEEYANSINIYPFLVSINKHYTRLLRIAYMGLLKATAAAMHASRHPNVYGGFLFSVYNIFYFLFSRKAAKKCVEYFKEEDFCSGRFLWNLPESIVVKFFLKKTYKRVKFYKMFDIPFEDDDANVAGASAKQAVLKAQSESDVKHLSTGMPPPENNSVDLTNPSTSANPAASISSSSISTSSISSTSSVNPTSTTSATSLTAPSTPPAQRAALPYSPGGTIESNGETVVPEKDNRTRWVTAQLVNELVDVKVPCLPKSYVDKKIPVRMRIIFTKKIHNQAFVMREKQGWFADRHYSINTSVDPDPTPSSSSPLPTHNTPQPTHTTPQTHHPNPAPTSTPGASHPTPQPTPDPHPQKDVHVHIVEPPPNLPSSTPHTSTNSTTPHPATNSAPPNPATTSTTPSRNSINSPAPNPAKRRMSIFRTAPKEDKSTLCPALIIYYHGGGFIAMTSFSHEMYTRKWAVDTGVPILAVDYSLAPEEIYPVQTAECFHAYKWALKHHRQIGSSAEKIILIGDSAGGNLVMGVLNRTILEGVRVPDAVILAYPALLLQPTPSLSRLCSVIDPLLNMQVLLYVLRQYTMKDYIDVNDPILSPALATDEVLAQYPPVRIIVGDMDPLLDDSIFMYKRLKALNKDVEISIQDGFGHGFFNFVGLIPQIHKMLDLVAVWLLEFIDGSPATRELVEAKKNA